MKTIIISLLQFIKHLYFYDIITEFYDIIAEFYDIITEFHIKKCINMILNQK